MIEFNDFIKEVNKKFQDELWADFLEIIYLLK